MSLRAADFQSTRQLGTELVAAPGALKQVEVLALAVSVDTQMSVTFDSGYQNEVQSVYTNATGGTLTFTYAGQTTGNVAFDATAGTLETALESLSTITDVTVTGAGTVADPWIVTFVEPGGTDLALMTLDPALLTGVATTIATDTAGVTAVNEIQSIYNGATGGTFTLTFDGQGPTSTIVYNAAASVVKSALESLSNITTVTVTGAGTSGDPWLVTFTDPGATDVAMVTADDTGLTGGTPSSTIAEDTKGVALITEIQSVYNSAGSGTFTLTYSGQTTGNIAFDAAAAVVETAVEALSNITDVTVTGAGTSADPWLVSFVDPAGAVAEMTATDTNLVEINSVSESTAGAGTKQKVFYLAADGHVELDSGREPWFVLPANKALTYTMSASGNISVAVVYEEIDT